MAFNIWDNSTADGLASTTANWSLDHVPTSGDVMRFDDATSSTNCLFDLNISCDGIDVGTTASYTGDIDMATFNLTTSDDMTFDGSGIFNCGTGTLTCSGNFDNLNQTTWTKGTSTLVMDGATKTLALQASGQKLYNLTISGTIATTGSGSFAGSSNALLVTSGDTLTIDTAFFFCSGTVTINGTITVNVNEELYCTNSTVDVILASTGTLSGLGTCQLGETAASSVINNGGTWSVTTTQVEKDFEIKAGTYGGDWNFKQISGGNKTVTFSGNTVFTGPVTFASITSGVYTIVATGVDVEFQGDVTFTESVATIAWTKSASITAITYGGTTTYTDNTAATLNLGDVTCNGTSLTLASDMDCDDFSLDAGAFDINGANTLTVNGNMDWASGATITDPAAGTFTVTGNFTANGQDISGATATWTLTVSGTAVASGTGDVKNSNAGGGTEIDASAGPWADSTGNTNWNFGVTANPSMSSPAVSHLRSGRVIAVAY